MQPRIRNHASAPATPRIFVELVRNNDRGAQYLVRTYDRHERPCWFLLKAQERSMVRLERTHYDDRVDLTEYGEVIASGWGHVLPGNKPFTPS